MSGDVTSSCDSELPVMAPLFVSSVGSVTGALCSPSVVGLVVDGARSSDGAAAAGPLSVAAWLLSAELSAAVSFWLSEPLSDLLISAAGASDVATEDSEIVTTSPALFSSSVRAGSINV